MTDPDSAAPPDGNNGARRRGFLLFGAALIVLGLAWAAYWLIYLRQFESTDDAYVAGDIVQVTSEVPGTVAAVHIDDTQSVRRGDPLVELDPTDARVAVASAEADLARASRDVSALFRQAAQLRAQLAAHEVSLARGRRDLERREPLRADGAVSSEEIAHAQDSVAELEAAVTAARAQLETVSAQIAGTTVATHPQVLRAAAELRSAGLALRRTRLVAPTGGIVAKRSVQIGERIAPGAPLLAIVALGEVWIDANFKEVQMRRIRIGQPVTVHADLYGSEVEYHGRVAGLSAGSGAAFALLPAQNASGNWIKIVQRIPIRVTLDPRELEAHPLRIGSSTTVDVGVADRSGPLMSASVRAAPAPALEVGEDPGIEARIAQIVAANGGAAAPAGTRPPPQ